MYGVRSKDVLLLRMRPMLAPWLSGTVQCSMADLEDTCGPVPPW